MPNCAQAAVYAAVYDRLTAAGALTALLAEGGDSITTHAVPDMAMPYVFLGAGEERPVPASSSGTSVGVEIEIYSAQRWGREVRAILDGVQAALAADLAVAGYRCVLQEVAAMSSQPVGDGKVHRGVLALQIICDAQGA